jgi:hypothetical protein
MPDMGQLRFIVKLAWIILLNFISMSVPGLAQELPDQTVTGNELIRLWDEAKLDSLLLLYRPFAATYPEHPATLFIKSALEKDGNMAVQGYLAVIRQGGDAEVIPRAIKRLSNYYQTVGNLNEAIYWERRLETEYPEFLTPQTPSAMTEPNSTELEPDDGVTPNERTDCYMLQLGAFQNQENAQKLLEKVQGIGLPGQIHERPHHGKILYLVWAGRFESSEEASETGKHLQLEYQMEYKVIKYHPENH